MTQEIEIEFLNWPHPKLGVTPIQLEGGKPLVLKAKINLPQRTWVGLTADEIDLLEELYAPPVHPDFVNDADHCLELIRHVEAKLKQKNGYDS